MRSPFPGMDAYLEDPDIWPDFYAAVTVELSGDLNQRLPHPYYAVIGRERSHADDITSLRWIEIRDCSCGHELITLIEIASPCNKVSGLDREAYLRKQQEVLDSDASLIEIDLLWSGERLFAFPEMEKAAEELNPAQYFVTVSRAWQRVLGGGCRLRAIRFDQRLPEIAVPLREGETETILNLQTAFDEAYGKGPYRRGAIDYSRPPRPPLPAEWENWRLERIASLG